MKDKGKEDEQVSKYKTEEKVESAYLIHHIENIVPSSVQANDDTIGEQAVEDVRSNISGYS